MGLKIRRSAVVAPTIPTSSMADIAFLLLIFFMVTTSFSVDKTDVKLPESMERAEIPRGAAIIVLFREVGSEGLSYRFTAGEDMSQPVEGLSELADLVLPITTVDPSHPFVLKAQGDLPYDYIDSVIDLLRKQKAVNVILLTQQETLVGGAAP